MATPAQLKAAPAASSLPPVSRWDLYMAIYNGNLATVKAYVEGGGDVNAMFHDCTPLMELAEACENDPQRRQKWLDVAKYLVSQGADVTSKNRFGTTVLHCAASYGADWLVPLLLENGALINALDNCGFTPLFAACKGNQGNLQRNAVARLLIETKKANVDAQSETAVGPFTCLAQAVVHKNWDLMEILLKGGADPNLLTSPNIHPQRHGIVSGEVKAAWFALEKGADCHYALVLLSAYGATFERDNTWIKRIYSQTGDLLAEKDLTEGIPLHRLMAEAAIRHVKDLKRQLQASRVIVLPDEKA